MTLLTEGTFPEGCIDLYSSVNNFDIHIREYYLNEADCLDKLLKDVQTYLARLLLSQ